MKQSVTRTKHDIRDVPDLKWVDKITDVMDSKFKVPGTKFRFGVDPILGLFPVVGDATSLAISGTLIYYMAKHGASRKILIMMIGNVILDATIGSIPILGSIFDFAYKANTRNINLLKKHYEEGKYQGSGKGILITIAVVFVVLIGLVLYGAWEVLQYLISLL